MKRSAGILENASGRRITQKVKPTSMDAIATDLDYLEEKTWEDVEKESVRFTLGNQENGSLQERIKILTSS